MLIFVFFFKDTATTEIYTLSLHDALPISVLRSPVVFSKRAFTPVPVFQTPPVFPCKANTPLAVLRSEEHTSELQSRQYLVCRLLLEKKTTQIIYPTLSILGISITLYKTET